MRNYPRTSSTRWKACVTYTRGREISERRFFEGQTMPPAGRPEDVVLLHWESLLAEKEKKGGGERFYLRLLDVS
jgi:hypothetical protein